MTEAKKAAAKMSQLYTSINVSGVSNSNVAARIIATTIGSMPYIASRT